MKNIFPCLLVFFIFCFTSCEKKICAKKDPFLKMRTELEGLLKKENSSKKRYAILNQIYQSLLFRGEFEDVVFYLSNYVERNPTDEYNSYWLLMCAHACLQMKQEKVAEYYFERIIRGHPDLMVQGRSIHFLCLKHLVQISQNHENRINYFNMLINRFPQNVSLTEMYVRLAHEYEQAGEWNLALKTYSMFLEQSDSSTIQIADMHDVYNYARNLIDFNNSPKNWTFKTVEELSAAVKEAITRYQPRKLDSYRSKVNFFMLSWNQEKNLSSNYAEFSMRNYMRGNRIHFEEELVPGVTTNEVYLRTTGWTTSVPTWYLYFRKVIFPLDPNIHGTWEWAGIFIGEMTS